MVRGAFLQTGVSTVCADGWAFEGTSRSKPRYSYARGGNTVGGGKVFPSVDCRGTRGERGRGRYTQARCYLSKFNTKDSSAPPYPNPFRPHQCRQCSFSGYQASDSGSSLRHRICGFTRHGSNCRIRGVGHGLETRVSKRAFRQ